MKNFIKIFMVGVFLLVGVSIYAFPISATQVFNATAVLASGTGTSSAVDLRHIVNTGAFALHYTITGSGTVSVTYSTSATLTGTYVAYATAIATGKTAGTYYAPFAPPVTPYMKIIVTETGTSDPVTVTARLVVQ